MPSVFFWKTGRGKIAFKFKGEGKIYIGPIPYLFLNY
jgi:hypothetical protein